MAQFECDIFSKISYLINDGIKNEWSFTFIAICLHGGRQRKSLLYILPLLFFPCGATAQIGPRPHLFEASRSHTHTHTHTHTIGLLLIIMCPHNFHMTLGPTCYCCDVKWLELEADCLLGWRLHVGIHCAWCLCDVLAWHSGVYTLFRYSVYLEGRLNYSNMYLLNLRSSGILHYALK